MTPVPDSEAQKLATLSEFTQHLADRLGTRALTSDEVAAVLNLAGDAAHSIMRPAAPMATFALGMLLGAAKSDSDLGMHLEGVRDALDAFGEGQ